MNQAEIALVEKTLVMQLPAEYKEILCTYPFPKESYIAESYLWNDPNALIEENAGLMSVIGEAKSAIGPVSQMFQIGFDGGEEIYLIDTQQPNSPVYVYDFESNTIDQKCPNLDAWIAYCHTIEEEIAVDETAEADRAREKRWWEFWR